MNYIMIFYQRENYKEMEEKKIVIYDPWGGLGDSLQYSLLPELYTNKGYSVYVSSKTPYRNNEILDLVWKLNPYIKGIVDEDGTPGVASNVIIKNISGKSWVYDMATYHGFIENIKLYPSIYYKPNLIPQLNNCLLYDTTFISGTPDNNIDNSFYSLCMKYKNLNRYRIHYTNPVINNNIISTLKEDQKYEVNSIYDLCDVIYSCSVFVTGISGSMVLASAIKQDKESPIIHSIMPDRFHEKYRQNNLFYTFPNIIYELD